MANVRLVCLALAVAGCGGGASTVDGGLPDLSAGGDGFMSAGSDLALPDLAIPASCKDGMKGGDETDVDCGGAICPACASGRACLVDGDCQSGFCRAGACASGFAAPAHYATPPAPSAIAVGDLDGDGKLDLAVTVLSGSVAVLLGRGDGSFGAAKTFSTGPSTQPVAVAAADFDRDGKLDLAATDTGGTGLTTGVSILLNQGQGAFGAAKLIPSGSVGLGAGDLDGDGKSDLVVLDYGKPSNVVLLRGDGAGGFQAQAGVPTGDKADALALGDLDGDGHPDVVTAALTSIDLFRGGAALQPKQSLAIQAGSNGPMALAVGDWNGDGKLDVAAGNAQPWGMGTLDVLPGRGDGTVGPPIVTSIAGGGVIQWLAAADWNRDGKLDLAAADGNSLFVLVGAGDGRFTARATDGGGRAGALAAADLNGDGKVDLVVVNLYDAQVSVLLNEVP